VLAHLVYVLQLALGVTFLLAAVPKLRRPRTFAVTVRDYGIVPGRGAVVLAPVLVLLESFLAVALLTGWAAGIAVVLAAGTVVAFAAAVAVNLRQGRIVSCGCFGDPAEKISARTLVRLALLLGGCVLLAVATASTSAGFVTLGSLPAGGDGALASVVELAAGAAALVAAALWLLSLPELVTVARAARPRRMEVA
jgi:Methylamine utilisation protein MauE